MNKKAITLLALNLLVLATMLSGCSPRQSGDLESVHQLAPMKDMPDFITDAPASVIEAYRYAAANPDILTHIPCYCGCGPMGHTSNFSCYVSGSGEGGELLYDSHALGCSICVDITLDVMRLREEGTPLEEIRAYIDTTYSPYGPSNME